MIKILRTGLGQEARTGLALHLRAAAARVTDFLLPPKCLLCQADVNVQGGVCIICWPKLRFVEPPRCARTGTPFPYDPGGEIVSAAALARPPVWNQAIGAVEFDAHSRALVHALKYRDRHQAAKMMAALMARAGAEILAGAQLLVPVPLHRTRLWQRRYNQSALLANLISGASGVSMDAGSLARIKPTQPQVGLSQRDRKRNLRNAFAVPESNLLKISGRKIIMIDDVLTTGATAEACAQTLYAAGAAQVDVLVFALVIRPLEADIT